MPPGFDGRPLKDDLLLQVPGTATGEPAGAGCLDLQETGHHAGEGEARMYAREAQGTLAGEIWVKADGSILITPKSGKRCKVGDGARRAVSRDGDSVTIGTPNIPPALTFWAWVAAVNAILVPLSGGTLPAVPPTEITGATVAGSATSIEVE
jgi:hypothetical protein